jgi:hypothetical protein
MRRCLYRGSHGIPRCGGLSVIADNVIQIGRCLAVKGRFRTQLPGRQGHRQNPLPHTPHAIPYLALQTPGLLLDLLP